MATSSSVHVTIQVPEGALPDVAQAIWELEAEARTLRTPIDVQPVGIAPAQPPPAVSGDTPFGQVSRPEAPRSSPPPPSSYYPRAEAPPSPPGYYPRAESPPPPPMQGQTPWPPMPGQTARRAAPRIAALAGGTIALIALTLLLILTVRPDGSGAPPVTVPPSITPTATPVPPTPTGTPVVQPTPGDTNRSAWTWLIAGLSVIGGLLLTILAAVKLPALFLGSFLAKSFFDELIKDAHAPVRRRFLSVIQASSRYASGGTFITVGAVRLEFRGTLTDEAFRRRLQRAKAYARRNLAPGVLAQDGTAPVCCLRWDEMRDGWIQVPC